jgi:hypothetical protein
VRAAGLEPLFAPWPAGRGDYARKINHAAQLTDATWIFTGADDLSFLPGWLRAAISVAHPHRRARRRHERLWGTRR